MRTTINLEFFGQVTNVGNLDGFTLVDIKSKVTIEVGSDTIRCTFHNYTSTDNRTL